MCEVGLNTVWYIVAVAVTLAILSPKEWHDVILDLVRKRYEIGPGGSATEEEEEGGSAA